MRTLLAAVLALFVSSAVLADEAVAGKTHILMSSPQNAFWVPLDGSPIQQIYPGHGVATNVATDGERFLIANGSISVSLYEEGGLPPLRTIQLDDVGPQTRSYAVWDAARNRYLVAWMRPGSNVHVSALTREGTLIKTVRLDTGLGISGLAVNGDRILIVEEQLLPLAQPTTSRFLRATLLNPSLTIASMVALGQIAEIFSPHSYSYQYVGSVIPFGDGFYVTWHQGLLDYNGDRDPDSSWVFGTRVTPDGYSLDSHEVVVEWEHRYEGRTLLAGAGDAFDSDLVNVGGQTVAVVKRENYIAKAPLTATFITPEGAPVASKKVADVELQDDRRTQLEVVRLQDGRTVAVSVVNFQAEIIPLDTSLPKNPRRRAVR